MPDRVADASRAAAQDLAGELGPGLAVDVEAALHRREEAHGPEQYFDPVALGGLIVSVATLAWTMIKDLRNRTATPAAEVIARSVRLELEPPDGVTTAQRDRIIDVVVRQTISIAPPEPPEK